MSYGFVWVPRVGQERTTPAKSVSRGNGTGATTTGSEPPGNTAGPFSGSSDGITYDLGNPNQRICVVLE
jgi:hypothetical protein